ncbi:hypothetical protein Golomagni_08235, partial [Golovinomyces magnicellulatus]
MSQFTTPAREILQGASRCTRNPIVGVTGRRFYAVTSSAAQRFQKQRAASHPERSRQADYLKDEVANRITERLLDVNRHFPRVLDVGANSCNIARSLARPNPDPDPSKPESPPLSNKLSELVAIESSEAMLYRDADLDFNKQLNLTRQVVEDDETIPYESNSFDMVMSSLSLHWVNDLPGILSQINNVLKPDSPFIGAML